VSFSRRGKYIVLGTNNQIMMWENPFPILYDPLDKISQPKVNDNMVPYNINDIVTFFFYRPGLPPELSVKIAQNMTRQAIAEIEEIAIEEIAIAAAAKEAAAKEAATEEAALATP
jgi:hypothetical protein